MSMNSDYTINDAFHDGFEGGISYILRYMEGVVGYNFNNRDVAKLASHLETLKPWKSSDEWEMLIHENVSRFR